MYFAKGYLKCGEALAPPGKTSVLDSLTDGCHVDVAVGVGSVPDDCMAGWLHIGRGPMDLLDPVLWSAMP